MADNQQYGPLAPKQTSASDIRSVIANATKTTGKGNTIATTNELEQKRTEKANQNSRAKGLTTKNFETTTKVNPNIAATNNTKATSVITSSPTTTEGKQKVTGPVANTITPQKVQDAFKNPQLQPINNVKVEQINGKTQEPKLSESYQNYSLNKNDIKKLVVESKDDVKKRQSEGVEKLYIDAYRKKKDGSALTIEDVLGNANYQKELKGIEQGVLQEMVNDANTLANAGKFDMDNAMALFEKYGDLGIQMDYSKLSPQTKAQFVGDMLNNNQSTLGKIISLVTPMGQLNYGIEKMTGKSLIDYANQGIEKLEKSSHKNLTDKEADKIAEKYIKELDEGFKDYYEMGKKSPSLVDYATNIKDAANMYYNHKYGVDEDQKIWKDKDKEREYNEKLNEIRSLVKEQHGDTAENTAKNALIGTAKGLLTVANMASDLPSFGKMILNLAGGGIEDTVGSVVSLGKTAYDTAKYAKDTGDFEVQWDAKDVRQRVAESGGYDNYDDMVAKLEKEWGDNPLGQFAVWSLKNADTSMDTANALGNYFIEKYGSLDDGWTAFKNDPAEVISDWMPVMQFKVALLSKLGLISEAKAAQIINASRWLDVYDKPFELVNKLQFGPLLKMEGKLLKGTGKTLGWTVKAPVKAVSNIVDTVMNQITGITKEDRKYIRENADSVLDYVNGKETSDGIINDIKERFDEVVDEKKQVGREYETIKESNTPIKTNTIIDNIKDTLAEFGVKFGDNGVEYTKVLPTSIENKVKELYKYINDFQKKGDTASAADTHYFRRLVDTLANWDNPNPKGLEADFINAVKEIRSSIDNVLKKEVPGMKQVDEAYSAAINTIKEFRQDWFNKDGTIKDTAYSKIRNLTNKGANQPKLERLEKLIPGVTEKLKSLAVAETIERATNATVGHYAKQIIGTGGSILGLTSLLTGGLSATGLVLGILGAAYATPKNFVHLLKWEGNLSKGIKDIIGKLEGKKKLTAKETSDLVHYVAENQEALKDTADYMSEKGLLEEVKKGEKEVKAEGKKEHKEPVKSGYEEKVSEIEKEVEDGKASFKELLSLKKRINDDSKIAATERIKLLERMNKAIKKQKDTNYDDAIRENYKNGLAKKEGLINNPKTENKLIDFVKKKLQQTNGEVKIFKELPEGQYGDYVDNLIRYIENPTDTTHGHELLHYTMDFMDRPTHDYILEKARGELSKKLGRDVDLFSAEEYIAEKYGIYLRKHTLDFGALNKDKTFIQKVRKLFDDVKYYFKSLAGDTTFEKLFRDITYKDQKLDKGGRFDFSYLITGKKPTRKLGFNELESKGGRKYKSVYHGSPADFDKFDSSHMGEGEGAQAHGWGHYVAVDERTGRHYAEMGNQSRNNWTYDGKGPDYDNAPKSNKDTVLMMVLNDIDARKKGGVGKDYVRDSINYFKDSWNDLINRDKKNIKAIQEKGGESKLEQKAIEGYKKEISTFEERLKYLNELSPSKFNENVAKRNLYTLDIPDQKKADTPTGSNYLEEDGKISEKQLKEINKEFLKEYGYDDIIKDEKNLKPVSEMTNEDIEKIIKNADNGIHGKVLEELDIAKRRFQTSFSTLGELFDTQLRGRIPLDDYVKLLTEAGFKPDLDFVYGKNGREVYRSLEKVLGSDKKASKFLESLGYDGIHYFGGRDGEAYVIFNDDALEIKDHLRYKKKTDSEGRELSDRQLKYFGNSKVRNDKGELVPVYHFTADNFNTVDFKKGAQNYFWFTSDKNASDRAMGVRPGMEKKRKDMYVDIKNPAGWEEYEKFGTDELKARGYDGVILKEKDGSFEGFIWDKENQVKYVDNQNPTRASKDMRYKKDLSLKEKDAEYEKAVKEGDTEKAMGMLRKAAAEKGYNVPEKYKGAGAWSAPSSSVDRKDFRNLDKLKEQVQEGYDTNVYALAQGISNQPDDYFSYNGARWYGYDDKTGMQSYYPIKKAMDSIKKQIDEYGYVKNMPKIEVYRAVPNYSKHIKEYQGVLDSYKENGKFKLSELSEDLQDTYQRFYDMEKKYGDINNVDKVFKEYLEGEITNWDNNTVKEGMLQSGGEWVSPSIDYVKEHGGNRFDGNYKILKESVPADELWWDGNDMREWGFDDGKEYVTKGVKNSRKNIEITYDRKITMPKYENGIKVKDLEVGEEKLIPLSKRFDEKKSDLRYKKDIPEDKKLIALHNLSMDNLKKNKKLGGFAMPSIAITKKGVPHTSYGDISIIFKGDAINPKNNRANKLYGVDAYTPTFPRIEAHPKSTPEARAILDRIEKETGLSYGEVHQWMEYKDHYEDMYPQLKKYSDEYDKLVDYKIFDGFTNTGKRKYLDYNLENIVKYMKKQDGKTAFGNFGKLVGDEKGKLKSVEDARGLEYKETDKESYTKLAGEYSDALWNVFGRITDADSFLDFDWFSNDIEDAFNKNDSKWLEKAKYLLGDYGDRLTIDDIKQIHKPIIEGANIKRPYAEAKPERPVGFDEVGAVVVPNEQLSEAKSLLKDTGLKVYGYKEGERMSTIDKVADDNGLRFKKAYHGTAADFDKFDSSHMGEGEGAQAHGWGHYVAVNKGTAEKYANMLGGEKYNALAYKGEVRNPEKYQSLMVTRFDDEYQLNYGGSDIEGFKEDFPMIKERMLKGVERSRFSAVEDYNWELNDIAKRKKLGEKITPAQKEKLERLKEYVQGLDRTIKEIKDTKPEDITFKEQGGRHLYDLDIPDPVKKDTPTGSNYLDEHGKLTEKQSEELITKAYNTYNEKNGLKPFDKITMEGVEKIGDEIVKDHQYNTTTFDYKKSFIDGVKEKVANGYSLPEAVNKELKWFTGMSSTIRKWKQAAGFFDALSDEVMDKFNRKNSGNGEGAYKYLTSLLGSDKAASKALESIGYDGIHYFGGRDGEAYVIFNDDSLEIKDHIRYKRKNTDDIVGHASPYSFDKYDASKRATGYGGQVYGAGIYTSEDLGMVAGKYGKKDADRFNSETMYKGLPLREQYDEKYVAQIMHDSMMKGLTFKEAKQEIIDAWKDTNDPDKKAMLKELGLMKKSDFDGKGNLYTYKINKDGKWLDWQKKTSPEDVNLISKELAKINKEGAKKFDEYMKSSEYATLGQNIYQELSRTLGGDQKASDFLKSIGFEGNKYKAESNKYNYVIFDYDKPINEHIRFKKKVDQTQTPEFKKWFEGSKVVDKSGKPLEVYHNTDSDFTEFDINKTKTGLGHFFTSDKKYLNGLKNKMSVYLDIKNPLIASPTNKISKQFPELKKLMERPEESKNWSFDERVKYEQMLDKKFDKELRKILKREGYDGVFYEDEKGNVDQFVALDPSQIKSATDNIGTFDKNNPDIRYKKGLQKKGNGLHKKSNASILAKGRDRK